MKLEKLTAEEARNKVQRINARIRFLDKRMRKDMDKSDELSRKLEEIQRYTCPHKNSVIDPIPEGSNFYTCRCTDCGAAEEGTTEEGIAFLRAQGHGDLVSEEMVKMAAEAKAEAGKGEKNEA